MSAATYASWTSFFETIVGVAGALLGLAFVTFQIRSVEWRARPERQAVAVTTLVELASPMFLGLFFLMPHHAWRIGGLAVGLLGYGVMAYHVYTYEQARKSLPAGVKMHKFDRDQLKGIAITFATWSILAWVPSLTWKGYTCIWMIFSGFSEAWLFLHTPAAVTAAQQANTNTSVP